MPRIIAWFVYNPVAANLLMMILVVGGLLALPRTHQEEFPNIEVDAVHVKVPYLGAAPEEVESAVCVRIEEAVQGSEGIDTIRSTASEGFCSVIIELVDGVDKNKVANDIKSKVDAIDAFPAETEKPVTAEVAILATVMQIAVAGNADERTLKLVGTKLRDDIAALPGVSQATLLYARPYEISIEVSERTLRRHGLTLQQVGDAIGRSSLDIPGGSVRTGEGEILLRTIGQAYSRQQFEDIVVLTRNDGTTLTVGELATVVDGFEEAELYSRLDQQPAVGIKVSRVGKEDVLKIAEQVKAYLDQARLEVPEGIDLLIWQDESQDLVDRLDTLTKNARSGLLLVLLILTLFLRFRLALWVAAGIPVAMLGTVALFPLFDISISTMSVMGFILVLGILVDDAIVIGERVYTHEQMGKDRNTAAIDGAKEVSVPVIFGVLTTMATFLPIVNIPGEMGDFFVAIGLTVIIALFFSVVESQMILPVHLAHRKAEKTKGDNALLNRWLDLQDTLSNSLQVVAVRYYQPAVERALAWRYLTAVIGIIVLALTLSLFASGRMVFQFFPDVEGTRLYAVVTLPEGTPIERTESAVRQLEDAAETLRAELDAELQPGEASKINHIFAVLGGLIPKGSLNLSAGGQSNIAEVGIELNLPADYSGYSTSHYANRWRELTGSIPDAIEQRFDASAFAAGDAIDIELYGKDFDELRSVAAELRAALETYNGVVDITDTFRAGKQEVQLQLLPEARSLGLTLHDLGTQVRHAFYGYEAQRIQRGKDDIRVMVRYPEEQRRSLGDLEAMRIRTSEGVEVPFSSVARVNLDRGYTTINRVDGQRVVRVIADVDRSVTTPESVLDSLAKRELADILDRHPGVTYSLAGEAESRSESMGGLVATALLALLVIYALLAIPLQSYLQPLVIMSVIPFGAVGAIVGHLIMGIDLVFFSLLGIVALSGVVVNSSLVLVDYINKQRQSGQDLLYVVSHAGSVRFRPIILTSVTTFIGLAPMMMDNTISLTMFVPMSVSLGFGVLMGTAITLFLVPCLYLILEDLLHLAGRRPAPGDETTTYIGGIETN
ncbi:efflux RND transporter permease subunit [Pseudohalioglobus lutimaris]|uniref:AcrB/AcrD/AcrF family protein n=1 Tax=Pseudohalioglobus lutimaris TaxID=1737061 RepID=A0A2N5WYR6_9GAMM|nr:efflux RND transporter permease subunit [Pseudohalioglobus lutimaris]PLW67381.1 AcrB/AcrD/AcrF family protein [Pseudohalioglobus lutimaris]